MFRKAEDEPPPQQTDVKISKEEKFLRAKYDHWHRTFVSAGAILVVLAVLFASLYQILFVEERDWAIAAVGASLTAAVAYLFSNANKN